MFRTSFCPNQCGHGGATATFKVLRCELNGDVRGLLVHISFLDVDYSKDGEYGDEKQTAFHVKLDGRGSDENSAFTIMIKALSPKDILVLDWNHNYVTRDGSSFPERVITKIEKLTASQAKELLE